MSYSYKFNCDNVISNNAVQATIIGHPEYYLSDIIRIGDRLSIINGVELSVAIYVSLIDDSYGAITFTSGITISIDNTFYITDIDITTTTTTLPITTTTTTSITTTTTTSPTTTTTTTIQTYSYFKSTSFFYSTASEACSQKSSTPYASLWTTTDNITNGVFLYTNSALTSTYVGNFAWIVIRKTTDYNYISIQVTPNGYITGVQNCNITTTTTTIFNGVQISRIPSHNLSIGEYVTFYVSSGQSSCNYASFKWILDGDIVSTEDTFTTIFENISTHTLTVEITEYLDQSWIDGNFYGGTFRGAFSGGIFNYGNLNDCCIIEQLPNNKIFTSKI